MVEILQKCLERVNSVWRIGRHVLAFEPARNASWHFAIHCHHCHSLLLLEEHCLSDHSNRSWRLPLTGSNSRHKTARAREKCSSKSGAKASNRTRIGRAIRSTVGKYTPRNLRHDPACAAAGFSYDESEHGPDYR